MVGDSVLRDLHVVTELEVGREEERLSHSDIAPCLEHHHSDRTARKCVANDEFGDDIQPYLLVGDRLNHSNRKDVREGDRLRGK